MHTRWETADTEEHFPPPQWTLPGLMLYRPPLVITVMPLMNLPKITPGHSCFFFTVACIFLPWYVAIYWNTMDGMYLKNHPHVGLPWKMFYLCCLCKTSVRALTNSGCPDTPGWSGETILPIKSLAKRGGREGRKPTCIPSIGVTKGSLMYSWSFPFAPRCRLKQFLLAKFKFCMKKFQSFHTVLWTSQYLWATEQHKEMPVYATC